MAPDDDPRSTRFRLRHDGREIVIGARGLLLGRGAECDFQVRGGLASRRHARVAPTAIGLLVEDLGSRNGVLVNERRITEPSLLAHGDVLGIGVECFEVIDAQLVERAAHLSTLPPPVPSRGPAPPGASDVDDAEVPTLAARVDVLSEREREVLEQIILGHTQKEIALKLHVSVKTIESHRAHIADKLGTRTRAEMVAYAISAGLLERLLRIR